MYNGAGRIANAIDDNVLNIFADTFCWHPDTFLEIDSTFSWGRDTVISTESIIISKNSTPRFK